MTYPPNNIAAYARATTQLRVSLLAVWLTRFGGAHQHDAKLMALYNFIAKPLLACMADCGAGQHQHKQQSAAVKKRALYELMAIERVGIDELGDRPETPDAWAAWWTALDAIAGDACQTWGEAYCWQRLSDSVELLAVELLGRARNPGKAETTGSRLYMRAMEASGW